MVRIIRIKSCKNCPESYEQGTIYPHAGERAPHLVCYKTDKVIDIIWKIPDWCPYPSLEEQAEVAFNAGIKTVVEFLNQHNTLKIKSLANTSDEFKHCGMGITMEVWQAQLERWGIK